MMIQRQVFQDRCPLLTFALAIGSILLSTGCVKQEVDLNFIPAESTARAVPVESQVAIGHFSDRRNKGPFWIGDIFGQFRYPKTVLSTEEPITDVVQNVIATNAEKRGLVSPRRAEAIYQLSGEIIRLESNVDERAEAHAEINIRLTTTDGSRQVYRKLHRAYLVGTPDEPKRHTATEMLKGVLDQAVTEALDSEEFRDWLLVNVEI